MNGLESHKYLLVSLSENSLSFRTGGEPNSPDTRGNTRETSGFLNKRGVSICHSNDQLVIYGEANLFNKLELNEQLGGENIFGKTDLGVIASAFQEWGWRCVERFSGHFGVVIVDLARKKCFVVRDHVGIIPIYYAFAGNNIIVSQNARGIHSSGLIPIEFNEMYLISYLKTQALPQDGTPFSAIYRLPPAHCLEWSLSGVSSKCFWQPSSAFTIKRNSLIAGELREVFASSVKKRLTSDGEEGVLLSGGLDSSAIACVLAEILKENGLDKKKVCTFSRIFEDKFSGTARDERKYIEKVLDETEFRGTFCSIENDNPLDSLEEYYNSQMNFPSNPFFAIAEPLFAEVALTKTKILFTGYGGDEGASTSGIDTFPISFLRVGFKELIIAIAGYADNYGISIWKAAKVILVSPLIPRSVIKRYKSLAGKNRNCGSAHHFLKKDKDIKTYCKAVQSPPSKRIKKRINDIILKGRCQQVLEVYNYYSHKHQILFLYPFLDKELVTFCMQIPSYEYIKGGWKRSIFRRAMKGVLPEKIRLRKGKSPFSKPFLEYLRNSRVLIDTILNNENTYAWSLVDRESLRMAVEMVLIENEETPESEAKAHTICRTINAVNFIQWIERHIP